MITDQKGWERRMQTIVFWGVGMFTVVGGSLWNNIMVFPILVTLQYRYHNFTTYLIYY